MGTKSKIGANISGIGSRRRKSISLAPRPSSSLHRVKVLKSGSFSHQETEESHRINVSVVFCGLCVVYCYSYYYISCISVRSGRRAVVASCSSWAVYAHTHSSWSVCAFSVLPGVIVACSLLSPSFVRFVRSVVRWLVCRVWWYVVGLSDVRSMGRIWAYFAFYGVRCVFGRVWAKVA